MSLLAPWFLAGLLLIGAPILAHLIRRATRDRVSFSSLRFLEQSAPRLDRRSRVQNPWLLALRCLIVAVLALGFARPFLRQAAPPASIQSSPRHVVAILDDSASMQRTGLWDAAREKVVALAASLGASDRFVLLTAGHGVSELLGVDRWVATPSGERISLVRSILADRQPGWGPTPLDSAGEAALARWEDMAEADAGSARRELVIVSDFTAGARVSGLANIAWPDHTEVVLSPVTRAIQGNASVHWLGWSEQEPARPAARVRVSRSFDAPDELYLQWRDARTGEPLAEREPLTLLPGASEIRLIPLPANAPAAVRLELTGDEQSFDNTLWLVRSSPREIQITYLATAEANDAQHARFYIERAIAGWRQPVARVSSDLPENTAARGLVIVSSALDASRITELRARIEAGAFALVLLENEELVQTASALAGETNWAPKTPSRSDALLGQLDFQHPLFSPFADPLYSDFTRIRFWQPHSVALPATSKAAVIARFDDDSPAVLEIPVGRGRVVVWGSGWTPTASQWVLSSKFVPWLQALAERAAGGVAPPAMAEIGEVARLVLAGSAAQWRSLAPAAPEQPTIDEPSSPGLYELTQGDERREVAVLVPAAESQTAPLSLETWEQLGVPLKGDRPRATPVDAAQPSANAVLVENRQQMWRWLLWLAAALLAFESLASLAVSRRRPAAAA